MTLARWGRARSVSRHDSFPSMERVREALSAALGDRYRIERVLGRGGMATVYVAEDLRHRRQVAIKVLRPDVAAAIGAERFLREIAIAARLTHPHVLPLIDSGQADGSLYYVMPYVRGETLRERLVREQRFALKDTLRIAREVGAGLDYAHREGFVHRDVKPENVLLAIGTPEYMSPEQAAGDRELDGRCDEYALACVVYEMLAGEPPFSGDSARAVVAKHLSEPPAPLRARRPDAPAAVEQALARALAKAPADRFASVAQFTAALEETRPGAAPSLVGRTRSIAVLPFVNASADPDNEYLSDGISDELINALTKVDGLRIASRTSAFALKGKPQDIRGIGALLGVSAVLEGTVRQSGDRLRITAQLYTHNLQAYSLYLKGRFCWNKRSQEGVLESISFFKEAIDHDPDYALAYSGLSDSYALQVDYRSVPVTEGYRLAREYALKALALDQSLPEAHTSLAWVLHVYDWDWPGAMREYARALELNPGFATAHHWYSYVLLVNGQSDQAMTEVLTALELDPSSLSNRRGVGWISYYTRRYDQALYHLRRAVAMNPTSEDTYRVMGLVLMQQGGYAEAERAFREAITLSPDLSYATAGVAHVLALSGRRREAEAMVAELEARAREHYVTPVALCIAHLGLRNVDQVFHWLDRAYEDRRGWLTYMKVDPIFDAVRDEPRYAAFLKRMNL